MKQESELKLQNVQVKEESDFFDNSQNVVPKPEPRSPRQRPPDLKLEIKDSNNAAIKQELKLEISPENNTGPNAALDTHGMMTHTGSCYCGAVAFEFNSRPKVKSLVNCTCESCQKYMDACLYVRSDKFKITAGEDKIASFAVGVGIVSNNFCSICGVKCFRKVINAPKKIANLLVAICGSHPPLEDTSEIPSPGPQQTASRTPMSGERCTIIGIGNVDSLHGKTISYDKILTCDMTTITWDEMKQLLFV